MPTYLYKCPVCQSKRDVIKRIADLDRTENCGNCGFAMNRQIAAPMVRGDYPPYNCPITGERIEGKAAHEANLRKHGCRILEPGETEAARRYAKQEEEAMLDRIGETAASLVANMPYDKQERLANELDAGTDLTVERSTPTNI